MIEFNKIVRGKIPEIIRADGGNPQFRIIEDDAEYLQALIKKDIEEGKEFAENPCLEELADKKEVQIAMAKALGYTPEQVEQARIEKYEERGGFEDRIFLESVD